MRALPDPRTRVSEPELAVFVAGVASMGLEILAGRIVAPQFGSGIYTWGSIIGVFLAALSLGYHHGGKRAGDRASTGRLAWLLLGTAAYVAVVVFASDLLVTTASILPLPSRFASLPAVTLLFGPPTYLLGFVSPYAAELSTVTGIGAASGRVYALGTVGSIIGAFGTTFVLVPTLRIEQIGLLFGIVLVATAAYLAVSATDRERLLAAAAVVLVGLVVVGSGLLAVSPGGPVVYETQTPYQELEVTQLDGTRTLYLDGQPHSAMYVDDPTRHVFEYTRYFHLPFLFVDDPDQIDRVLFVGGGGFTGPKRFLAEYNVTVDVAELDPEVTRVAREYFAVTDSDRLNVHTVDGRQFLRETDHTYDLIVLDAYKKDRVPFHLTTVEFMRLAKARLSADGVLFANLISAPEGSASRFYRAEYRTIDRVFPRVYGFTTRGTNTVQNVELLATRDPELVTEAQLRERNRGRAIGIDLSEAIDHYRRDEPTDDVPVLRDDRAPVDSLLEPAVGERYVVEQAAGGNVTARP